MDVSDAALGRLILTVTTTVFVLLVFWINTYPFVEQELSGYHWVARPQWLLVSCALWGLCFVGALMWHSARQLRCA